MRKLKITSESLKNKNVEKLLDCLVQIKYFEVDKKLQKYQRRLVLEELKTRKSWELVASLVRHAL